MKYTCLSLLCAVAVFAQDPAPEAIQEHRIVFNTNGPIGAEPDVAAMKEMKYVAEGFSSDHKVVTGAPYSASAVTQTVQTLADGNHIRHNSTAAVARDSQGRTRREPALAGPAGLDAALPKLVFIQDPVAQTSYVLEPDTKTARSAPAGAIIGGGVGSGVAGARPGTDAVFVGRTLAGPQLAGPGQNMAFVQMANTKAPVVKKETLGSETINGVRADGTRVTRTIAAGDIGNENPIEVVTETWYSPDLQAVVRSKTSDPRMGETTFELQNIDRSEPAASQFTVPADYTVQENKGPVTVMRHLDLPQK